MPTGKKDLSASNVPNTRSTRSGGGSSSASKDDSKKSGIPGFLTKTFEIFANEEFEDLCGWGENGDTIIIKKVPEFSALVLPRYFKHSNFQSFVRQLNMYDFHKTVQDPSHGEFRHEYFRRGREDLLHLIKRKVSQPASSSSGSATPSSRPASSASQMASTTNSSEFNAAAAMMTLPSGVGSAAPVCGLSMLAESSSSLKSARSPASVLRKHPRNEEDDAMPVAWERRMGQLEEQVKALEETNQGLWSQLSAQNSQISTLRSSISRALGVIHDILGQGGQHSPALQEIKTEVDGGLASASSRYLPPSSGAAAPPAEGVDENEGLNMLATSAEEAASFNRVSSELWRGQSLTAIPSFSRFFSQDGYNEGEGAIPAAVPPSQPQEFGVRGNSMEGNVDANAYVAPTTAGAGAPTSASYETWPVDQRARKRGRMTMEDAHAIASQLGALHRTSQATIHKIDSLEAHLSTLFDGGDFGLGQQSAVPAVDGQPIEGSHLTRPPSIMAGALPVATAMMTTAAEGQTEGRRGGREASGTEESKTGGAMEGEAGEREPPAAPANSPSSSTASLSGLDAKDPATKPHAAPMSVDLPPPPSVAEASRAQEGQPLVRQSASFHRRTFL